MLLKWLISEYFKGEEIPYTDEWEDNLLMLRVNDDGYLYMQLKG